MRRPPGPTSILPLLATALAAQAPNWVEVDAYAPTRFLSGKTHLFLDERRQTLCSLTTVRGHGGVEGRLWAWIGGEWAPRTPPDPRLPTTGDLVFDRLRGRAVLCAPRVGMPMEHWEWDGSSWQRVNLPSTPVAFDTPILCWDDRRHRVLAWIGSEFWSLDGSAWAKLPSMTLPVPSGARDLEQDRSSPNGVLVCRVGVETWLCEQETWRKVDSGSGPDPRRPFRLVNDAGRLLLLAGESTLHEFPIETWRWTGADWVRLAIANPPPTVVGFSAAEAPGGGVILDSGANGPVRTWLIRGGSWVPAAARQVDELRSQDAIDQPLLVPDAKRSCVWKLLMRSNPWTAGLWQGRGGRWQLARAAPPFAHGPAGFARDEARDRLIAVVQSWSSPTGEIWECDGESWQRVVTLPWLIRDPSACHDPVQGRTVCVADLDGNVPATFLWDGRSLVLSPAPAPGRGYRALAFDPQRQRLVLFAVDDPGRVYEWQGSAWTAITPPGSPPFAGLQPALFFDPALGEVVRVGSNIAVRGECHSWNGQRWALAAGYAPVPSMFRFAVAADPATGRALLFGIAPSIDRMWLVPQTFVLTDRPASLAISGTACGGVQPPRLLAFGLPRIGTPLQLDLTTARASASAAFLLGTGGAQIPFGPCTLYVDPMQPLHAVPARTNRHGVAELPLALPYDLALRGLALHAQAFVDDPNVAGTRIATSAALALRVGD